MNFSMKLHLSGKSRTYLKENVKRLACLMLVIGMAGLFCACKKKKAENADLGDYRQYLGDYYYDCSISAMVFETPDGETEPGILYRQVTNLDALSKTCPIPICFFFYSDMQPDTYGLFASLEELAENYHDQILIVTINALAEKELSGAYNVRALPEAIIIKDHMQKARFDGESRGSWTAKDLAEWILAQAQS